MRVAVIGTIASSILGFRRDLIKALLEQGHEVFALAMDFNDETKQLVRELGATPVNYALSRAGVNPIRDLLDTIKLAKILRSIQPDLVFSYFVKPVIFGTLAARLANVKRRVAMLEGLGFIFTEQPEGVSKKIYLLRKIQVLLYRLSFPLLDQVIFLNPDDPKDLIARYKLKVKKVSVLGGIGLDLKSYPYAKPDLNKISFLFIGRLLKEKGINEFIAAGKIVKKLYPEVGFTILGGLDEENPGGLSAAELKHLVNTGLIDYPGHVSNIYERIVQSSVFVLPSYYREGVPRSTQEAMAVGRPIITTNVPGCRETVIDEVNGFLIPPWDPQCLADKMIYFIKNQALIEKMGLESYYIAQQKFDAAKVNKRLIELLDLC
ncbi:MAG: glycosyltransferase family 1 protein [Cellvibrio sp. 79]|nr:MAG: glycosyltransferase family 1 protein [Cellvibrio sp. 79]